MIQKTRRAVKLAVYRAFQTPDNEEPNTAILTRRHLTASYKNLGGVDVEHDIIEILPQRKGDPCLYILNIFSLPSACKHRFGVLFSRALREEGPR